MTSSLRLRAETCLWRVGWAWLLSAALLAAGALLHWLVIANQATQLQAIAREHAAVQQRLDLAGRGVADGALSPGPGTGAGDAARRQAVDDVLADAGQPDAQVRQIALIAARYGITLLQGDFQYTKMKDSGITGVQLAMPVRAAYPQLRLFVQDVLLALPNVSLDQVMVKRENVAQDQAEARLKWTLWSRSAARIDASEGAR